MNITVTLPTGEKQTQSFSSAEVTIGRGQKADFVIRDESLSRLHAKIELINHEFFVTDLESSNGVFLDGNRIPANQKTPFSTFLALQLGPLECQVTEGTENTGLNYGQPQKIFTAEGIEELSKTTKAARNINRVALNTPMPAMKKEKAAGTQFPVVVAMVLGMLGLIIYFQFSPEETPVTEAPPVVSAPVSATPEPVTTPEEAPKVVKNEFLSFEEYEGIRFKKSCKQHFDICHAMEMTEDESEGIFIDGKEAFIFVSPLRKIRNFTALATKADAQELIALSSFLSSSLYSSLKSKELEQVHVILQNEEFKMTKVFRFNAHDYKENVQIMSGIRDALFTGNSLPFWQAFNAQVKSKTF